MPISLKLPRIIFFGINYKIVSLNNNQISKKSKYTFMKFFGMENYKK